MASTEAVGNGKKEQHVFVMRHGIRLDSVDLNWEKTTDRPYDTPITNRGKEEAYKCSQNRYTNKDITRVISSPFLRCLQTGQEACNAIGIGGMITCNGLSEVMSFGAKMPSPPSVPVENHNVSIIEYDTNPMPPFPEKLQQSLQRYRAVIQELADKYYPENILLLTHQYGVEQALCLGLDPDHLLSYEVVYCGCVELIRSNKDSSWKIHNKYGIYQYDFVY